MSALTPYPWTEIVREMDAAERYRARVERVRVAERMVPGGRVERSVYDAAGRLVERRYVEPPGMRPERRRVVA